MLRNGTNSYACGESFSSASVRGNDRAPLRSRRGSASSAALIALLFLAGVALSLYYGNARSAAGNDDTPKSVISRVRPSAGAALGTFVVKDTAGRTIPIVTPGEPAIIMVSSRTCEWCKQTFNDLHALAAGRPLVRLKLLTLEGASEGAPMLAHEGLHGAQLLGPNDGGDAVFLTFRYPGTPTFLAVDRDGHVSRTWPGYMDRTTLGQWYRVMVGDADAPK